MVVLGYNQCIHVVVWGQGEAFGPRNPRSILNLDHLTSLTLGSRQEVGLVKASVCLIGLEIMLVKCGGQGPAPSKYSVNAWLLGWNHHAH